MSAIRLHICSNCGIDTGVKNGRMALVNGRTVDHVNQGRLSRTS